MSKLSCRTFKTYLLALIFTAVIAQIPAAERKDDPVRWEKDIQAFEAADKTNPPPKNAILFIGSSSIKRWTTLSQDFPEHKVINRGFGGSHLDDSVYYFDRIVAPYKPKMIVVYVGSNDINFGKTPEQVFAAFKEFVAKTHKALPKTRVAYISIAPNPARWSQIEQIKATNKLIEDFIQQDSRLTFINVFPEMLGPDGKPKPDIFVSDKLHMNQKGYELWTTIVRPYLKK
jgi:lysophospholipase L1-like esterase